MRAFALPLLVLACAGCPTERMANGPPIQVPATMSREDVRATLQAAEATLQAFAARYGWEKLAEKPFYRSVEIFDDKAAFDRRLIQLGRMPADTKLPATYTAALEQEVLIAVSPELYAKLFPDGVEPRAYEKLFTHELAHRLHARLVEEHENEMGPIWFFEGFAVLAADQFSMDGEVPDRDALWRTFRSKERGSYRTYGRAMRVLVDQAPLQDLVMHARQPDFLGWLATVIPER